MARNTARRQFGKCFVLFVKNDDWKVERRERYTRTIMYFLKSSQLWTVSFRFVLFRNSLKISPKFGANSKARFSLSVANTYNGSP